MIEQHIQRWMPYSRDVRVNILQPGTRLKTSFMSQPDIEFKSYPTSTGVEVAVLDEKTVKIIYESGHEAKITGEDLNDDPYVKEFDFFSNTENRLLYILPIYRSILWRWQLRFKE